jgi:hypothetical protein
MKRLLVLVLVVAWTLPAAAAVWVNVYLCDGKTPLPAVDPNYPDVYREIMVGTRLTLIISSDTLDSWGGNLQLSRDDAPYGRLSGRGGMPPVPGGEVLVYPASCFDAAGTRAVVQDFLDEDWVGLGFTNIATRADSRGHPAYPGDWFVVDYYAEQVGSCEVQLYQYGPVGPSTGPEDPPVIGPSTFIQTLSFMHVPTRDFNADTVVDFRDFARLATQWRRPVDPTSGSEAALDLDADLMVGASDLAGFCRHWLDRTDCNAPPASNTPIVQP